jgi:hypothetical protein
MFSNDNFLAKVRMFGYKLIPFVSADVFLYFDLCLCFIRRVSIPMFSMAVMLCCCSSLLYSFSSMVLRYSLR